MSDGINVVVDISDSVGRSEGGKELIRWDWKLFQSILEKSRR